MGYKIVGNTVVEWKEDEPFVFTMKETTGPKDDRREKIIKIDSSDLRAAFTEEFILNLNNHLMELRNKISLSSIKSYSIVLRSIFRKVIDNKLFQDKIGVIDEVFLLCLGSVKENLEIKGLEFLRSAFRSNPHSPIFSRDLHDRDFPVHNNKKGGYGRQIDRILVRTLSRSAVTHILDLCDTAYDSGKIDIGHYSFSHLAFAIFCRPESYLGIRLRDFTFDSENNKYYIEVARVKSREHNPGKIRYCINEHLGVLLKKQRQHVIATFGHLVANKDIDKLALFPARRLINGGSRWASDYANQNFGRYESADVFSGGYPHALKKIIDDDNFTLAGNVLRHTVGTQLAQAGVSAQTIQGVLKHATDTVCRAYVDIAFHGMVKELSEAMRPAFEMHLPALLNFRSKTDSCAAEKIIRSEDLQTGQIEKTGECGKDIACQGAPIVCYGCFRFRPCWDADHSINLRIAQQEIDDLSIRGKPFLHMVDRAKAAKNNILIIMNASDRYRDSVREGSQK